MMLYVILFDVWRTCAHMCVLYSSICLDSSIDPLPSPAVFIYDFVLVWTKRVSPAALDCPRGILALDLAHQASNMGKLPIMFSFSQVFG